jgi:hypothetical protein
MNKHFTSSIIAEILISSHKGNVKTPYTITNPKSYSQVRSRILFFIFHLMAHEPNYGF